MKIFLLCFILLVSLNCFAQGWETFKFDDNLTVSFPDNYEEVDTMGQHVVRALIDNALVMIQRLPNTGSTATNIASKDELIKQYKGFQEGVVGASENGSLIDQTYEDVGGLHVTKFSLNATMQEEMQVRHYYVAFFNENWYAVQMWEVADYSEDLEEQREEFFSSVQFPAGMSIENQMSSVTEGSAAYKMGHKMGKILFFPMLIGVLVLIAFVLTRVLNRKKKKEEMKEL